jgi:hypothetical protein
MIVHEAYPRYRAGNSVHATLGDMIRPWPRKTSRLRSELGRWHGSRWSALLLLGKEAQGTGSLGEAVVS